MKSKAPGFHLLRELGYHEMSERVSSLLLCNFRRISDKLKRGEFGSQEWEGLTEEEDWVVPGGANDSLSSNTELGRAVRAACDELDALGRLVRALLQSSLYPPSSHLLQFPSSQAVSFQAGAMRFSSYFRH